MEPVRWTLLIHNIPPKPAYLRIKVANRLSGLGAVALKNSVYVLPDSPSAREGFMWLAQEIEAGGGKVFTGEARFFGDDVDAEIRSLFLAARNDDYAPLLMEAETLLRTATALSVDGVDHDARTALIRPVRAALDTLTRRAAAIQRIDFFHAAGGHTLADKLATLESLLARPVVQDLATPTGPICSIADYQNRIWVTRANIFVDRIASAWLIRRFIDPEAQFRFVAAWGYAPQPDETGFDMPGGTFTHEGDLCTFEVLIQRFGLAAPAMDRMAGIIHAVDMQTDTGAYPESAGVEAVLSGIVAGTPQDEERLRRGYSVMEDLFHGISARMNPQRSAAYPHAPDP